MSHWIALSTKHEGKLCCASRRERDPLAPTLGRCRKRNEQEHGAEESALQYMHTGLLFRLRAMHHSLGSACILRRLRASLVVHLSELLSSDRPIVQDARVRILKSWVEQGKNLALRSEGDRIDLVCGQVVLLSSGALGTEVAFGELVTKLDVRAQRVLVGGLGFGGTARGVLSHLAPEGKLVVSERFASVIALPNEGLSLDTSHTEDARLEIRQEDVWDTIASSRDLDAILLDVDNGPEWATFRENARVYWEAGLAAMMEAVRPGGFIAVWSGYARDRFSGALRRAGFRPETVPLEERGVVAARAYLGWKT